MPASPFAHALPVHPHQLEVQEFDTYALIVDLRSAEAFAVDHIPHAVSMPWSIEPGASPSATGTGDADAAAVVAMETAPGLSYAIEARLGPLARGSAVLLYCDQGGAISAAVARQIAARGVTLDVLPGGWGSYHRWVAAGIDVLARTLEWRWIRSGPGGLSQAVVDALRDRDEQVLKQDGLLASAGVPGLVLGQASAVGVSVESCLVDALRRFDPGEPVWVDEVVAVTGEQVLPAPLLEALQHAPAWRIEASPGARADLLLAWMADTGTSAASVEEYLARALPEPLAAAFARRRRAPIQGHGREALAAWIGDVLDPLYESLAPRSAPGRTRTLGREAVTAADLDRIVAQLTGDQMRP